MATRDDDHKEFDAPALSLMRLMWEVDHELHSVSKRMEATLGVTWPQRLAVRLIGLHPGISAGALAGLLHLHPGTLSGVISRLERSGFVTRTWAAEDGRRMALALTARGKALAARQSGTVEGAVQATLKGLPAADRAAAQRVLAALARHLREGVQAVPAARRPGPPRATRARRARR